MRPPDTEIAHGDGAVLAHLAALVRDEQLISDLLERARRESITAANAYEEIHRKLAAAVRSSGLHRFVVDRVLVELTNNGETLAMSPIEVAE